MTDKPPTHDRYSTDTWPINHWHMIDIAPTHHQYMINIWPIYHRHMFYIPPTLDRYITYLWLIEQQNLTDIPLSLADIMPTNYRYTTETRPIHHWPDMTDIPLTHDQSMINIWPTYQQDTPYIPPTLDRYIVDTWLVQHRNLFDIPLSLTDILPTHYQ